LHIKILYQQARHCRVSTLNFSDTFVYFNVVHLLGA